MKKKSALLKSDQNGIEMMPWHVEVKVVEDVKIRPKWD
jgi:hypothetical protein